MICTHDYWLAAMRLPTTLTYRWDRVALSLALAIGISLVALTLTFRVRQEQRTSVRKVIGAVVMGRAIPLMNYAGMWALLAAADAALYRAKGERRDRVVPARGAPPTWNLRHLEPGK